MSPVSCLVCCVSCVVPCVLRLSSVVSCSVCCVSSLASYVCRLMSRFGVMVFYILQNVKYYLPPVNSFSNFSKIFLPSPHLPCFFRTNIHNSGRQFKIYGFSGPRQPLCQIAPAAPFAAQAQPFSYCYLGLFCKCSRRNTRYRHRWAATASVRTE